MDRITAEWYQQGYESLERSVAIIFFYSYFVIWSIGLAFSLLLLILFIFSPSSLHTTRSSQCLIIILVCLWNISCLYYQVYMISDAGDPQMSSHACRFVVYISTLAKPIGLYLTVLFGIERLSSKVLSKMFIGAVHYRQLLQRVYSLLILLGTLLICSLRLYQVLSLIPRNPSKIRAIVSSKSTEDTTDRNSTFNFCFRSMNTDRYATLLSFYVAEYSYEYMELGLIFVITLVIVGHQCCLSRLHQQQHSSTRVSVRTKFYLCLSSCILLFESLFIIFHSSVVRKADSKLASLQLMLFTYNFRCIFLPLMICIATCDPLKECLYELCISRPYLDNIDENDVTQSSIHGERKPRRPFTRNNIREPFDDDELQVDS